MQLLSSFISSLKEFKMSRTLPSVPQIYFPDGVDIYGLVYASSSDYSGDSNSSEDYVSDEKETNIDKSPKENSKSPQKSSPSSNDSLPPPKKSSPSSNESLPPPKKSSPLSNKSLPPTKKSSSSSNESSPPTQKSSRPTKKRSPSRKEGSTSPKKKSPSPKKNNPIFSVKRRLNFVKEEKSSFPVQKSSPSGRKRSSSPKKRSPSPKRKRQIFSVKRKLQFVKEERSALPIKKSCLVKEETSSSHLPQPISLKRTAPNKIKRMRKKRKTWNFFPSNDKVSKNNCLKRKFSSSENETIAKKQPKKIFSSYFPLPKISDVSLIPEQVSKKCKDNISNVEGSSADSNNLNKDEPSRENSISEEIKYNQPSTSKFLWFERNVNMSCKEDSTAMSTDDICDSDVQNSSLPRNPEIIQSDQHLPSNYEPGKNSDKSLFYGKAAVGLADVSSEKKSAKHSRKVAKKTRFRWEKSDDAISADDESEDINNSPLLINYPLFQSILFSPLRPIDSDESVCLEDVPSMSADETSENEPNKASPREDRDDPEFEKKIEDLREILTELLPAHKKGRKRLHKRAPKKDSPEEKSSDDYSGGSYTNPVTDSDQRKERNSDDSSPNPSDKEKPHKKKKRKKKFYLPEKKRNHYHIKREKELRLNHRKSYRSLSKEIGNVQKRNRHRILKNYFKKFSKPENPWRDRVLAWIKTILPKQVIPEQAQPGVSLAGMSSDDYFYVDNFNNNLGCAKEMSVGSEIEICDQSSDNQSSMNKLSGNESSDNESSDDKSSGNETYKNQSSDEKSDYLSTDYLSSDS